jgi:photosystem II stability/assembly factor-like uncharacterized protein
MREPALPRPSVFAVRRLEKRRLAVRRLGILRLAEPRIAEPRIAEPRIAEPRLVALRLAVLRPAGRCLAALLLAVLLLAASDAHAQPFASKPIGDSLSFVDLLRASDAWSRDRDLGKERSWKWYKRWEADAEQRLNPGGRRVDAGAYVRAAAELAATKASLRRPLSGTGWFPVGPFGPAAQNFTDINAGIGRINCVTFHPTDSSIMWVGVAQGGVWKSNDGGESWRPLTDGLPILRISDIAVDPSDPDVIYIAVGDYGYVGVDLVHTDRKRHTHYGLGVFKSTNGGDSWAPTGLGFELDSGQASLIRRVFIDPRDSRRLLAAGTGGTWRSSDAGGTWTRGRTDFIWDIERDPSDPDRIYASTGHLPLWGLGAASLVVTSDFGGTWQTLPTGIGEHDVTRMEIGIAPSDPRTIYLICSATDQRFHAFLRSTDRGATWTTVVDRAQGRNILGGRDGGPDDLAGQGSYDLAILVDPEDPQRVFVGGVNIWGSSDGGATWDGVSHWTQEVPSSIHADQHYFAFNPLDRRFYVCNDGGLYSTARLEIGGWDLSGGGQWATEWRNHGGGMAITSFYRVGASRSTPGYVVAGAQDNSTFYFDASSWSQIFGGDGMDCFIDRDDPRQIYGSAQFGVLLVSRDGGESGERLGWEIFQNDDAGEWTTPFTMRTTGPRTFFAGFGNLWRSDGVDSNWRRVSSFETAPGAQSPTPMTAIAISQVDTNRIYIAKRIRHSKDIPSEVWTTADGGATWRNITAGLPDSLYPTSLASHPRYPRIAWVTYSGFVAGAKVFRTTDAGATWTNISRNLPNIPANVVIHDNASRENTLYLGTDIGVFTISDGMDGWIPFAENLPNVIISDLELQPSSRRLYAATFGRGVWATDLTPLSAPDESVAAGALELRVIEGDVLMLETSGSVEAIGATLEIIDVLGRVVHSRTIGLPARTTRLPLGVALRDGVYFARVVAGDRSSVARFVVER